MYYNAVSVVSPAWREPMSGGEPVRILDGMLWFSFALLKKARTFSMGLPAMGGDNMSTLSAKLRPLRETWATFAQV